MEQDQSDEEMGERSFNNSEKFMGISDNFEFFL